MPAPTPLVKRHFDAPDGATLFRKRRRDAARGDRGDGPVDAVDLSSPWVFAAVVGLALGGSVNLALRRDGPPPARRAAPP